MQQNHAIINGIKMVTSIPLTNKIIFMAESAYLTSLSSVLEKLRLRKQDNEFTMTDKGFGTNAKTYKPEDLLIIKTYRFEGASDPSDNSILYLIEATDGCVGYALDAYGVYSNHEGEGYDDFIRKIHVKERDEQQIFGEDKIHEEVKH